MLTFYNINILYFVACVIYYQVVGRGPAQLNNFTGTGIFDLKSAIKDQELLQIAASQLKLFVREPTKDKKDLDELQDLVDASGNCDFSTLFQRFSISYHNPISVEIPGKYHSFRLTTHIY